MSCRVVQSARTIVQVSLRTMSHSVADRTLHCDSLGGGAGRSSISIEVNKEVKIDCPQERSLTDKDESNEDENANLEEDEVEEEMTQIVVTHAIVDPWTMAVEGLALHPGNTSSHS